jgi:hypothetical protein
VLAAAAASPGRALPFKRKNAMSTRTLPSLIALVAATVPALLHAQTAPELAQQLQRMQTTMDAMQARIKELESGRQSPDGATWGITPEQLRQLNRTTVKADALEESQDVLGYKGLKITGLIDPTFIATSRQDRTGFQFLNSGQNFEYAFDNGAFGMAMIDFQKELEAGLKWRLTLAPNRGGGGIAIDGASIVHEASLSVPLTDLQTRVIAGQIPDWSGHEFMQPTLNKLVTHNLLFDFTLPAVYTGAGLDLLRGAWAVKALLANVNTSKKRPGQKAPALAYRVDYYDYKNEFMGFGLAGLHGKLSNPRADDGVGNPVTGTAYDTRDTMVHSIEVDGFFSRGNWTVTGQLGLGTQRQAAITADPVTGELRNSRWWGASSFVGYKITPRLEAVARLDYLNNARHGGGTLAWAFADGRNGLGPDPAGDPETGANRTALSFGGRYTVNSNLAVKAEYRLDRANLPVFVDLRDGSFHRTNNLFGASMVMSF